jgi:uroporphyrinogen decarboxylase
VESSTPVTSSRTLVRQTLAFDRPARVPRQAWVLPWAEARYPDGVARLHAEFPDDLVTAPQIYKTPIPSVGSRYEPGTYVDEWGCRFQNIHGGVIGVVHEPLIRDWNQLETFRTPDEVLDVDTGAVRDFCRATGRFTLAGTLVRPFERLCFIRTMEQAMIDLAEASDGLRELLRRMHEHYVREVEVWARTDVDAIVIMDDWGMQTGLLVSPRVFRACFLPMYADYAAIARQHGKFVFMHSDGHIVEILDDLIAAGVHAINSQVACMGVPELGRRFRGRITFWGEVDRQELLAFGSIADIDTAVREIRAHLYADGGVIAQCEFGPGAIPDNVLQVFRAWQALDLEHQTDGERR